MQVFNFTCVLDILSEGCIRSTTSHPQTGHDLSLYATLIHIVSPSPRWPLFIVFSNEKKLNLSYNDGRVRVWRTHGLRLLPECLSQTQKHTTQSIMVWDALVGEGWDFIGEGSVLSLLSSCAFGSNNLNCNIELINDNKIKSIGLNSGFAWAIPIRTVPMHLKVSKFWKDIPVNTKHLYNIYTTSSQRRRRWSNIV